MTIIHIHLFSACSLELIIPSNTVDILGTHFIYTLQFKIYSSQEAKMYTFRYFLIWIFVLVILSACSYSQPVTDSHTYIQIPELSPQTTIDDTSAESRIRITAVGDIMCHKLQYTYAKQKTGYTFSESFNCIKDHFENTDLLLGNLETTFAGTDKVYSEYPTFNTPDEFAYALKEAGFDILTTANNHSLDRKFYGLSRTLDVLDAADIMHTGSYKTPSDDRILFTERNGIKIAVIAYTYGTNGIPFDKGTEYSVNMINNSQIISDIQTAKSSNADIIILSVHFGQEYKEVPNDSQQQLVQLAFTEGVDIVLGSHPHVIQPYSSDQFTDKYGVTKRRVVFYSLGNFISAQRTQPRDAGLIAHLEISKKNGLAQVETIDFVPTWVDQSSGAGIKAFRVLSINDVLNNPDAYELITQKDIYKLNRSLQYITRVLPLKTQITP